MAGSSVAQLRKRFANRETFVVETDKERLTMTGDNGIVFHERSDHFWSDADGDEEGTLLWQGSAFHGHGIRLKPLFVRQDGRWINVFTGRQEVFS